ncbi:MAG: hypothetical protein ACK5KT_11515 [Dysgonomonas sp.]
MNNNELKKEVADLIHEVEKTHRYSMSNIYGTYNKVFEKNETPQSCASCLIRKVNELKEWLEAQSKENAPLVEPIKSKKRKQ